MTTNAADRLAPPSPALRIAICGATNAGKSSLVNALVGREVVATSARGGETDAVRAVDLTLDGSVGNARERPPGGTASGPAFDEGPAQAASAPVELVLIDTPGIGDLMSPSSGPGALAAIERADLVLMVVAGDITALELRALEAARAGGKSVIVVLNKTDLLTSRQRQETEAALHRRLDAIVGAENIVGVAASPLPRLAMAEGAPDRPDDGGDLPDIEPLRERLIAVARSEGPALRRLSTFIMLAPRRKRARKFVETSAVATALAVALNPSPVLDVLGGGVALAAIVTGVAKAYGVALDATEAQGVARELWRASRLQLGGILAAGIGGSLLKTIPGLGTAGGALVQAGAVGYFCYVFGQAVVAYVENGKSWAGGSAQTILRDIVDSNDRNSITGRIVDQVRARLPFS